MKKARTVEQQLVAARPHTHQSNTSFIDRTMEAVTQAATEKTYTAALDPASIKVSLWMRFRHLPAFTMVAITLAGLALLSGTAYAAYRWLEPRVHVTNITPNNDDNKREYTLDSQCGDELYNRTYRYEMAQNAPLSDDEVYKVFKNSCEYRALSTFADNTWVSTNTNESIAGKKPGDTVAIYNHHTIFAGGDSKNFGINTGTVSAIDDKTITIELRIYVVDTIKDGPRYRPEGTLVTRTLPLLPGFQVWEDGAPRLPGDVGVGDTVMLVDEAVYLLTDSKHLGKKIHHGVIGILKTDLDPAYVWGMPSGDPAIVNTLAGLSTCHNNDAYLCATPLQQMLGPVYSPSGEELSKNEHIRSYIRLSGKHVRTLQGRITKIDGTRITLKARGKSDTIRIELPFDAVARYNMQHTPKATIGSLAEIRYIQEPDESTTIPSRNLLELSLVQYAQPDGTIANY